MIVDIIKSRGTPFKCNNCDTYFAWKPDKQGSCSVRIGHPKCKEVGCSYYYPAKKKCPECGSDYISEISPITYKIMREIRRWSE